MTLGLGLVALGLGLVHCHPDNTLLSSIPSPSPATCVTRHRHVLAYVAESVSHLLSPPVPLYPDGIILHHRVPHGHLYFYLPRSGARHHSYLILFHRSDVGHVVEEYRTRLGLSGLSI